MRRRERAVRWSTCHKCSGNISTQQDCNYVHCREIKVNLCPSCYETFLDINKDILELERENRYKSTSKIRRLIYALHDSESGHDEVEDVYDCKVCYELIKLVCSEKCIKKTEKMGNEEN